MTLWAINWGASTVGVIASFMNPSTTESNKGDWVRAVTLSSENLILGTAVVVFTFIVVKHWAKVSPAAAGLALPRTKEELKRAGIAGLIFLGIISGSQFVNEAFKIRIPGLADSDTEPDKISSSAEFLENVTRMINAGSEEIFFTAGIVIILSAAGIRQYWVWIVAIVLRLSFHLYYLPNVHWVILWSVGALLLFRTLAAIWATTIVHILWDLVVTMTNYAPTETLGVILLFIIQLVGYAAICSTVGFCLVWLSLRFASKNSSSSNESLAESEQSGS